ncbi:MAG: 3-isopropylmalate dehydratase large subunit [Candidatus Lokiarchaeota archaeon]|nr:3-isopropylmalate dehydratase large subunit [Candidatus Lokiarchaeota archaeon]
MGYTISEKILARASGEKHVTSGQKVTAKIDLALTHDVLCGPAAEILEQLGGKVWDPSRIIVTPDHFVPSKDIATAKLCLAMEEFVKEQKIENYYPIGQHGICHIMLSQEGHVVPGDLVVGTDSHTCTSGAVGAFAVGIGTTEMAVVFAAGELWFRVPETMYFNILGRLPEHGYISGKDIILTIIGEIGVEGATYRTMEFDGNALRALPFDERFTVCNMSIEAGAKTGIVCPDEKTQQIVQRTKRSFAPLISDKDAEYIEKLEIEAENLEPVVAKPHLPSNVVPARELANEEIDQAFIGSCTGGRLTDLRVAAKILRGRQISPDVRLIVIPGTQKIWLQALREGLLEIFAEVGAAVSTPTCGPCIGGHMGVLGPGEKCIATTNRNFIGRMGDRTSEVFLASSATVAASALLGKITDPRDTEKQ